MARSVLKGWVLIGALMTFLSLASCGPDSGDSGSGEATPTPTPTPSTSPTPVYTGTEVPLTLTVSTMWSEDQNSEYVDAGSCSVSASAARGSTSTCTVLVEEARMFFSKTRFTIKTERPDRCALLMFQPYYYVRSASATYTAIGETSTINCSKLDNSKCFGGAAVYLVPNFPKRTGLSFETKNVNSVSYDLDAEINLGHYAGYAVNYLLTNDLTDRASTIGGSGTLTDYVGGSMVDYKVTCMDEWGYPYHTINVTIHDEDKDGAESDPEDNFPDWP